MDASELRAANADREKVAEKLRTAFNEGRLDLNEYDERIAAAYAARTYAELNALLADLPGVLPGQPAQVVPVTPGAPVAWTPGPDGRYPGATGRWIVQRWAGWIGPVVMCTAIWGLTSLAAGDPLYFWPVWVAVPWGIVLFIGTIRGIADGEPQRSAARHARRAAEREGRRTR